MNRRSLVAALVSLLACLPGCLVVGGHGTQGPRFAPAVLASLTPGVSTRAEVLATLGPPSEYVDPDTAAILMEDELRLSGALDMSRRAARVWTWQWDEVDALGTILGIYNRLDVDTRTELVVALFDEQDVLLHLVDSRSRDP